MNTRHSKRTAAVTRQRQVVTSLSGNITDIRNDKRSHQTDNRKTEADLATWTGRKSGTNLTRQNWGHTTYFVEQSNKTATPSEDNAQPGPDDFTYPRYMALVRYPWSGAALAPFFLFFFFRAVTVMLGRHVFGFVPCCRLEVSGS